MTCVTTLIALDIPIYVESGLLLHYDQPAWWHRFEQKLFMSTPAYVLLLQYPYVDCGLDSYMISISYRVRLSSWYFNHDDTSYTVTPVQTWIRLLVSQTWTTNLTFYVESRFLLHCCMHCYHDNERCRLRLHLEPQLSIRGHKCF